MSKADQQYNTNSKTPEEALAFMYNRSRFLNVGNHQNKHTQGGMLCQIFLGTSKHAVASIYFFSVKKNYKMTS